MPKQSISNAKSMLEQCPLSSSSSINNSLSNAHEKNSAEQVFEKASQICDQNAQSIQDWQTPSFDEISDMLKMAGFTGQINQQQYTLAIKDFKDHWSEEALKGNPLLTDSKRKNKLRDWIKHGKEFKPAYSKPKSNPVQYGGANDPLAVNAKWGQDDDYAPTKTAEEFWAEFDAKQQAKAIASQPVTTPAAEQPKIGMIEL